MRIRALAAACLLCGAVPAPAEAQSRGFYVGAGAGFNWLADTFHAWPPVGETEIGWGQGWGGVLSGGFAYGNGVRIELELAYKENDADDVSGPTLATRSATGRALSYGVMLNALYDFNMGWPVIPYLGVGVGWQWHEFDGVRAPIQGGNLALNGDFSNWAVQGIAGIGVPIRAVPGLTFTAEYRYQITFEDDISGSFTAVDGTRTRVNYSAEVENHSLLFGLRYQFGMAAPAVAAAAAPAPARTFLVFFDWDRADLTDRARQIIAEAAQASRQVQTTRIEVAGHADRTGTAQHNQRLSERRAENVAAELIRNGVNRSDITVQGFGFNRPLVPTAAGVREPQNRRVEIVLR